MLKDIVAIVTDGASVMTKLGRLLSGVVEQQLCLAHGTHLAITKVIYCMSDNSLNKLRV